MFSKAKCIRCNGTLKLQSDAYGTFFSCFACGTEIEAKCPHCATESILVRPGYRGLSVSCKVCGCANGMLAAEVCAKTEQEVVPA